MWPAFAKAAGIAPDAVSFVNVGPTAKIAALKSHTVDIISDFYNEHDLKVIEFGSRSRLRQLEGHRAQSLRQFADRQRRVPGRRTRSWSEDFVRISQKAYAACVADVAPCLKALLDQASGLDKENQQRQWERIKFLMTDEFTTTKALGWIDAERMKKDYELVQTYLGMEKPFDGGNARSRPSCSIRRSRWMPARSKSEGGASPLHPPRRGGSDRIARCDPGRGTPPAQSRIALEKPLTPKPRCASASTSPRGRAEGAILPLVGRLPAEQRSYSLAKHLTSELNA